jgi:hypothetical protein
MTTEFDVDSGNWEVKIVGTGLRDSADVGEVSDMQINKVSQDMKSHSDTMAVFTITDVLDLQSTDVNLFFPVGIPEGHDLVRAGINVEPRLMMVTPNSGTIASTLVTATVPGVGKSTTGLDLVDETGRTICRSDTLKVIEYGVIQCWTRIDDMGADPFQVKLKHGDSVHECSSADSTKCEYTQNNAENTFPKILSLTKTDTTIVITGESFYTVGYTVTASYGGFMASSVVVDSETQATATFDGGIPIYTKIE